MLLACALLSVACSTQDAPPPLKDLVGSGAEAVKRLVPSSDQVTVSRKLRGLIVSIQPGRDEYPGIALKPPHASWDLSSHGHIEARLVNTGSEPLTLTLRVDNAGDWKDNPWDAENVTLAPGEAGTITTIFGYSYGHKPSYALKPSAVTNLMLFTSKTDKPLSFRLVSVSVAGPANEQPAVAPEDVRVKPADGLLLGVDTRTTQEGGMTTLRPHVGRWDLRDFLEVRIRLRNDDTVAVSPRVRLESNGGLSNWQAVPPLPPGNEADVVIPFSGDGPVDLTKKDTGSHVTSDSISAVTVDSGNAGQKGLLRVASLQAILPPPPALPTWLGSRPPVEGAWVKTLDDEFNDPALDASHWSVYGPNYWDKQTHWSRNDVLLGGGVMKLRYEKKTGFGNDDPTQKPSDYAAGYLHTYGLWRQRYGYFEARMKLPTTPGLWPGFWMMPDRGPEVGPEQWRRQDTGNGGMEFDIMEHLTRWGRFRYNIAMHYDGYGKDQKQLGSDKTYVRPDKDGFITCGLLWTPGLATYYCNGQEVLRWKDTRVSNVPGIVMFTLPEGGWDNSALDETKLPADFVIDYVRIWQRRDLASSVDGVLPRH